MSVSMPFGFRCWALIARQVCPSRQKRFSDPRVHQYWDGKAELGNLYSPILKADGVAWDVYLLFDRDAEWKEKDKPPVPVYVMDKIGLPDGKSFDGDELAKALSDLRSSKLSK